MIIFAEPMKEEKFNKLFNIFILAGMSVCVILATVFKLDSDTGARVLLLISAVGALSGVASTVLAANGSIWNFLFGLIDVCFYSIILFKNGQPAQLCLHLLYILPMEFIGFFKWKKVGLRKDNTIKARRLPVKYWINVSVLFLAVFFVSLAISYQMLRIGRTDIVPVKVILDAVITTGNIVAFVLMAGAYAEQWYLWMVVNVGSILLWGLTPILSPGTEYAVVPLIKYVFYMINSVNGIRMWYMLSRSE